MLWLLFITIICSHCGVLMGVCPCIRCTTNSFARNAHKAFAGERKWAMSHYNTVFDGPVAPVVTRP